MPLGKLLKHYNENFGEECPVNFLMDQMEEIVTVRLLNSEILQ